MKTPQPPPKKESAGEQIRRILDEIENAVSALPLGDMVFTVKNPRGTVVESTFVLEHRAEAAMRDLDFIARLGNKDAIRALRNLGNLAADTLLSLRPASPESCGEEPKPPHPFSLPVLTLQGDLSSITQILTREANAISSLPYSSIRNEFHARPNHSVPNIVIDT